MTAPNCDPGEGVTHFNGCACHERERDALIESLKADVDRMKKVLQVLTYSGTAVVCTRCGFATNAYARSNGEKMLAAHIQACPAKEEIAKSEAYREVAINCEFGHLDQTRRDRKNEGAYIDEEARRILERRES